MTILWGSLESTCVVALGKLAGYSDTLDVRIIILTAHANFQQRVDAISALCENLAPDFPGLADYEQVVKQLKAAQRTRNKFAHNPITLNEETGDINITYATARGSLKLHLEPVYLNDIKEASAKIHEAICSLHSLISGTKTVPLWERT